MRIVAFRRKLFAMRAILGRWWRRHLYLLGEWAGISTVASAWFMVLGVVLLALGHGMDGMGVFIVGAYAGVLAVFGWLVRRRQEDRWAPPPE